MTEILRFLTNFYLILYFRAPLQFWHNPVINRVIRNKRNTTSKSACRRVHILSLARYISVRLKNVYDKSYREAHDTFPYVLPLTR